MVDTLLDNQIRTTREKVLRTLLEKDRCTIIELAEAVDINPISVRHHIQKLEADGMVSSNEEKHNVGRPRRVYFLSEKGHEQFPKRYLRLTLRLIEQMKDTLPKNILDRLFVHIAEDIASEYNLMLDGLPIEERLIKLMHLLNQEGFTVEWQKIENEYHIHEISCPYYHISQMHPEICIVDQKLISTLLSIPVKKIACILTGDNHCTYVIPENLEMEKMQ